MSDRQLGDDWWLASDGKWYPPQSRPAPPPSPPAAPPPAGSPDTFVLYDPNARTPTARPVRRYLGFGLTGTLAGFVIGASALAGISAVLYMVAWAVWSDADSTFAEVIAAFDAADGVDAFYVLVFFVSIVLFLIWVNIAYKSAQSRGATDRKWSSGWAVGGWFIPFANMVIPKLVVNEIDRMSVPNLPEPIGTTWRNGPRLVTSDIWWGLYLLGLFVTGAANASTSTSLDYVWLYVIGNGIQAVAGALLASTILTIGKRLREPRDASAFGAQIP